MNFYASPILTVSYYTVTCSVQQCLDLKKVLFNNGKGKERGGMEMGREGRRKKVRKKKNEEEEKTKIRNWQSTAFHGRVTLHGNQCSDSTRGRFVSS